MQKYVNFFTLQVSERVHLFWCSATQTPQCLSASNSRSTKHYRYKESTMSSNSLHWSQSIFTLNKIQDLRKNLNRLEVQCTE